MKKLDMNELVSRTEGVIYKVEPIEIKELGITIKKYMPIEEKYGLVNRIFNMLYDIDSGIYDSVNATFLVPVIVLEAYSSDIEFPKDMSDLDATGIYDMLLFTGAWNNIKSVLYTELIEINNLIKAKIEMEYRKKDLENPLFEMLKDFSSKTPEELSEVSKIAEELMQKDGVKEMIDFKKESR